MMYRILFVISYFLSLNVVRLPPPLESGYGTQVSHSLSLFVLLK